jgi:hypothetical protein
VAQDAERRYYLKTLNNDVRQKTENRLAWLRRAVVVAFIAGLLLSPKLWVSTREYPLTPLWDLVPPTPYPADYLLFGLFVALLVGVAVVSARSVAAGWLALAATLLAAFFVLQDQSRLQPWFYQYSFMIAAFCFYGWGWIGVEGVSNACRLIVAAIYFWSGLQKANASFVETGFSLLIIPLITRLPDEILPYVEPVLLWSAYAVPVIEAAIGLGLLTRRFRKAAVIGALLMHTFILLCVGPLGLDYNSVVWPWNIAMVAFAFILFWRPPDDPSPLAVLRPGRSFSLGSAFRAVVLVLFAFMPLLNFFGLWDSYLSSSLYSYNTKEGYILVPKGSGWEQISLVNVSLEEMNVPPYPAERVIRNVFAKRWCEEGDSSEPLLYLSDRPGILSGERSSKIYSCNDARRAS